MILVYATILGLRLRPINVNVQKIDGLVLETYEMTLTSFLLQDSQEKVWFFEKTFSLTNIRIEVVLGMPFLTFNNRDIEFTMLKKFT